jgi:hypothetical protein
MQWEGIAPAHFLLRQAQAFWHILGPHAAPQHNAAVEFQQGDL